MGNRCKPTCVCVLLYIHLFRYSMWILKLFVLYVDDDGDLEQPDKEELQITLKTLSAKLDSLKTCHDLISKHGTALQRALVDLEQTDTVSDATNRIKPVNERATVFRITSSAMISVRTS
jgi:hypothetical protein